MRNKVNFPIDNKICPYCKGSGTLLINETLHSEPFAKIKDVCTECKGTGYIYAINGGY
jgi:DnaJ-class molecular chaperone